jgi:DNA-binding FrmR family transcriptional regulator
MKHGHDKVALSKRLHRIEGQVRGIERMVEDDRFDHVNHCVADALSSGDPKEASEKSRELAAVQRFARTR